jgi:hypothetical protein
VPSHTSSRFYVDEGLRVVREWLLETVPPQHRISTARQIADAIEKSTSGASSRRRVEDIRSGPDATTP